MNFVENMSPKLKGYVPPVVKDDSGKGVADIMNGQVTLEGVH